MWQAHSSREVVMTTTLRGCTISFPALIAVTTAIAIHPTALGQWKVTNLHPAGATQSFANSTTGTQVVGWANVPRAVGSAMHAFNTSASLFKFGRMDLSSCAF